MNSPPQESRVAQHALDPVRSQPRLLLLEPSLPLLHEALEDLDRRLSRDIVRLGLNNPSVDIGMTVRATLVREHSREGRLGRVCDDRHLVSMGQERGRKR